MPTISSLLRHFPSLRPLGLVIALGTLAACSSTKGTNDDASSRESAEEFHDVQLGAGLTGADGYHLGSIASELLQSGTEIRILDLDDAAGPTCQQRRFLRVSVEHPPEVESVGKGKARVFEHRWSEHWFLDRCGAKVQYKVDFTEIGNGGAYFTVAPQ